MKTQTFGLEVEMNRITRQKAAQVVARTLPTNAVGDGARVEHTGGSRFALDFRRTKSQSVPRRVFPALLHRKVRKCAPAPEAPVLRRGFFFLPGVFRPGFFASL